MDSDILRIAYVHGRNGPHPFQGKLAKSVGAKYVVVDFRIPWHGAPSSRLRRYLSWLVCSLSFPNKKEYDIFLAAGPHFTMVLMRLFLQINKKQKIIVHLGDETLYSLMAGKYSKITKKILLFALRKYDALICEGKMGTEIARSLLGNKKPIYTVFPGIPKEHYQLNKNVIPNHSGKKIVFMGSGPSGFRIWYKGLDLILDSFAIAFSKDQDLELTIIGDWDKKVIEELLKNHDEKTINAISFVGYTNNLQDYLSKGSLYLHCARGEAFGITILIAMLAGLVPSVSFWTGAKEVVERVSPELILQLDKNVISEKILWFFNLPLEEKLALSNKCRQEVENYNEEKAIRRYQTVFTEIVSDFEMKKRVNLNYSL